MVIVRVWRLTKRSCCSRHKNNNSSTAVTVSARPRRDLVAAATLSPVNFLLLKSRFPQLHGHGSPGQGFALLSNKLRRRLNSAQVLITGPSYGRSCCRHPRSRWCSSVIKNVVKGYHEQETDESNLYMHVGTSILL